MICTELMGEGEKSIQENILNSSPEVNFCLQVDKTFGVLLCGERRNK